MVSALLGDPPQAETRWCYPPALGEDPERRTKAKTATPPMTNPSTPISTVIPTDNKLTSRSGL